MTPQMVRTTFALHGLASSVQLPWPDATPLSDLLPALTAAAAEEAALLGNEAAAAAWKADSVVVVADGVRLAPQLTAADFAEGKTAFTAVLKSDYGEWHASKGNKGGEGKGRKRPRGADHDAPGPTAASLLKRCVCCGVERQSGVRYIKLFAKGKASVKQGGCVSVVVCAPAVDDGRTNDCGRVLRCMEQARSDDFDAKFRVHGSETLRKADMADALAWIRDELAKYIDDETSEKDGWAKTYDPSAAPVCFGCGEETEATCAIFATGESSKLSLNVCDECQPYVERFESARSAEFCRDFVTKDGLIKPGAIAHASDWFSTFDETESKDGDPSEGSDVAGNDRAVNAAGNGMPADGMAGSDVSGVDAAGIDMAGSDVGSDTAGNDIGRGEDASERGSDGKSSMRATREPHPARFQDHPRRPRNELVVVIEGFVHDAELRAFVAERFGRWATTKVESARPKPPMRRKHGIIVFQHAGDCDRARDAFGRRWFQAKNGAFWLQ